MYSARRVKYLRIVWYYFWGVWGTSDCMVQPNGFIFHYDVSLVQHLRDDSNLFSLVYTLPLAFLTLFCICLTNVGSCCCCFTPESFVSLALVFVSLFFRFSLCKRALLLLLYYSSVYFILKPSWVGNEVSHSRSRTL